MSPDTHEDMVTYRQARRTAHDLLAAEEGGRTGGLVDWFIMLLIAANVTAVVLSTVDPIRAAYGTQLRVFEIASVVIFTVEYVGRVWSAVDRENPRFHHPITGRLRFAVRPLIVVDFVAILPFYLAAAGIGLDLRFLRALRLIRFLRLLKLVRYSESMRAFVSAFAAKRDQLILALSANALLLIVASSLIYFVEHDAQPETFSSIPATMWWAVITLTTVGYGDVTPTTPLGRFFGGIVAVLGIGLFALPASIMASGFLEASTSETRICPECGAEIDWEQGTDHADERS